MKKDDLNLLGRITPPEPGEKAREAALLAAMTAFDDAAPTEEKSKNSATATQGFGTGKRPNSITNPLWSFIMTNVLKPIWTIKPATMATVSGALMLPLAGVVAWNVFNPNDVELRPEPATVELRATPPQAKLEVKKERLAEAPAAEAPKSEQEATVLQDDLAGGLRSSPAPSLPRDAAQGVSQSASNSPSPASGRSRTQVPADQIRIAPGRPVPPSAVQLPAEPPAVPKGDGERFTDFDDNGVKAVAMEPVSTFSIDVDTASYARVRRALMNGQLPEKDMVRVEELINYFSYAYPLPQTREQPFQPSVTVMPTPWNQHTQLMHIGIKGFDIAPVEKPRANLVFLLDVSGSMNAPDKLPLLISSFQLLLQKLDPQDKVSIVTYAGRAATVLTPTQASDKATILSALQNLQAGGSTAGAQGIEQAYRLAEQNFVEGGVNRVMLATDGDFNVGISDPEKLKDYIAKKRDSGIFLSVFGFGTGNYNDALMQSLAQNGNGTAAYIDTLAEAQKTLVEEAGSTLFPIATDVKIQMEFNPARIAEYRLIGYETRALKREDFNNDKVDAGDIGSGHSVTAIYELTPVGSPAILNDRLRYGKAETSDAQQTTDELGFLKLRYKLPGEATSKLISTPVAPDATVSADVTREAGFASAVAAFGQKLRGNAAVSGMSYEQIADLAAQTRGEDRFGYRSAFLQLVRMAASLSPVPDQPKQQP